MCLGSNGRKLRCSGAGTLEMYMVISTVRLQSPAKCMRVHAIGQTRLAKFPEECFPLYVFLWRYRSSSGVQRIFLSTSTASCFVVFRTELRVAAIVFNWEAFCSVFLCISISSLSNVMRLNTRPVSLYGRFYSCPFCA